jgi:hypothetical protein
MDFSTLTDTELQTYRVAAITETERRANLSAIPDTVALLAAEFVAAGGTQSALDAAILPAP